MQSPPPDPPVSDVVPSDRYLTGYDQRHLFTYLRLLDADAEGADCAEPLGRRLQQVCEAHLGELVRDVDLAYLAGSCARTLLEAGGVSDGRKCDAERR